MKRTYHLCWSGGDEVLFRTREDYIHGIICLCIAAHEKGCTLVAYCLMSNHVHICIRGTNIKAFIKAFRYSYSRYFNSKYHRHGRLGEKFFFKQEVKGLYHLLTVISYILRNPLHHGVCKTPFEYEFSSVHAAFGEELGQHLKNNDKHGKIPYRQLPSRHKMPAHVKIDSNGHLLSESIVDTADLEHQFSTARSYLYFMNRLSGEAWEKEQLQDNTGNPPIRVEDIEQGVRCGSIQQMLANETGRNRVLNIDDIKLCTIIDEYIDKTYKGETVYTLPVSKSIKIAESLRGKHHLSREQISRCMALPSNTLQ